MGLQSSLEGTLCAHKGESQGELSTLVPHTVANVACLFKSVFFQGGLSDERKQNLHPWVKVDQAIRLLPPRGPSDGCCHTYVICNSNCLWDEFLTAHARKNKYKTSNLTAT